MDEEPTHYFKIRESRRRYGLTFELLCWDGGSRNGLSHWPESLPVPDLILLHDRESRQGNLDLLRTIGASALLAPVTILLLTAPLNPARAR